MTSTDLIPLPMFEGREIRAIEKDGQIWIPLVDLNVAFGLERTTLYNLIKRNPDLFDGCTLLVDKMSTNMNDALFCVNEQRFL